MQAAELHRLDWENRKRADEIRELQKVCDVPGRTWPLRLPHAQQKSDLAVMHCRPSVMHTTFCLKRGSG